MWVEGGVSLVFTEPLHAEDSEQDGGKTEGQTREPEDIDADVGGGR